MAVLVLGATGSTGRLLVEQLLDRGLEVKVIVRDPERLPEFTKNPDLLSVITAGISEIPNEDLSQHLIACDAVVSCLGHNLTWKGIYGHPQKLVTDATRRLCEGIKKNSPKKTTKFILMNTSGNRNRDLNEPISFGEKIVIGLIRLLLPPHRDNEMAADYLRTVIGQSDQNIEWTAVRPDNLIDENNVTEYEVHASPIRSAIFNAGHTSRINVGNFMVNLITNNKTWNKWKGQMPVIYNAFSK